MNKLPQFGVLRLVAAFSSRVESGDKSPHSKTACLLACFLAVPLLAQDITAKLDDYVTRLTGFGFSGVALVAKDGHILLEKGYGVANRARNTPMTADTVISIGSITKQFTAAAILKLEMQGKLHTTDTIGRFFPNAPADKKDITLHQLLTHTAGLRSDFTETDYDPVGRDAYVKLAFDAPLMAAPGKEFHYANSGYSLLAAIVEIASGQPYERYLYSQLFEPVGMKQTGYKIPKWPAEKVAHGYRGSNDWGTILEHPWAADGPYWELRGNGGIHSTVGDMYRWAVALEGDTILTKEARAKFQTGYVAEGPAGESHYAYGWSVTQSPRGKLIEHNGGNMVFAADFLRYVEAGVVVYVASNTAEFPAPSMSHPLGRITLGLDYVLPPKIIAMPAAQLAKFAGTYVLPSGGRVTVRVTGNSIEASADDQEAFGALNGSRGPMAAQLNARVTHMVEGASKGDYAAVAEAFPERRRAEVEARERDMWQQHAENFGKFRSARVLGTASDGPGMATLARLEFERGTIFVRYLWDEDGNIRGMMMLERPPANRFLPESESSFVSFSLPGPSIQRLRFQLDPGGAPPVLLLGAVSAKRE